VELLGDLSMTLPRLRAPQGDGEILAHPPLAAVADLVDRNRAALTSSHIEIDGIPLADLRRSATAEAVCAARDYLGLPTADAAAASLILCGHQPELFHPGVWVKNFAVNGFARRRGALALNLVVDNDTAKATTLRIPVWDPDPGCVRLASVPFDHFAGEVPYEERPVADEALLASFRERIAEFTRSWNFEPLLPCVWAEVAGRRGALLGEQFAAARRAVERRWGCDNLEVPLSRLCATNSFLHFARAILRDLPAFAGSYNRCVHAYRRRHGIRSRNHPVPDLARDGDWHEAPFWAWRAGARRRARLFARITGDRVLLRAGDDAWEDLPARGDIAPWRGLEATGRKLRTRALTTTLFARLLLADLFVHGIGGGKYDELNDEIMRAYFRIGPPGFLVLTGTLRLPLPRFPADAGRVHTAERALRDLYWNPHRHLAPEQQGNSSVGGLLNERRRWQEAAPTDPGERHERFVKLRECTEKLRPLVADALTAARDRRDRVAREAAANAVLGRRDFAFCLFPEATIRPFCTQFLAGVTSEAQPAC
jgi:hypothetical protein